MPTPAAPSRRDPLAVDHPRPSRRGLALCVLTFLVFGVAWNLIVPPYENLDELEHAEVIRYIATTGSLPIHEEAEDRGYHVRQEASQPPLYHLLAAGWQRLLGLPNLAHSPEPVPSTLVACGPSGTYYNKATWRHDAYTPLPTRSRAELTIHGTRVLSTLLQVSTLLGVWTLARRGGGDTGTALLATAVVAFNPQFLLLSAGVNNDNAVIPLATWGLVVGYTLWLRGPTWPRTVLLGLLSGLAALSKLSGIALVGVGGIALLFRIVERRTPFPQAVAHGLAMVSVTVLLVAPWLARNARLYGDPTALAPMLEIVGRRDGGIALGEAWLMLRSYWGQLPCSFYPDALYWPAFLLIAGGLIGLVLGRRRVPRRARMLVVLCAIWLMVITLAWVRWDSMTAATGGRLLFPAIASLACILSVGWDAMSRRLVRLWSALLPIWSLTVLIWGPTRMLAPPALGSVPALSQPSTATFGDSVALLEHDARIRAKLPFCTRGECEPVLDLDLDWQALRPIGSDLVLVIQLVTAVPGGTELRLNYNHWPGRGNAPTTTWPTDRVVRDRYRLPLPASTLPTQAWRLQVAMVSPATGQRLPVHDGPTAGGDAFSLGLMRVPGTKPEITHGSRLSTPVSFIASGGADPSIELVAAEVMPEDGEWTIRLIWDSLAPLDTDLVTFVHAYDAGGELLATGDGPPMKGAFPTHLWEPGDRIASSHTLSLDAGAVSAQLAVGLYLPESGVRLTAVQGDTALPNDAVVVWARGAQEHETNE